MATIHLQEFEDSFVIHFGIVSSRINAYTLASTLTNIADAAKAANATLNPGYDIEVVVEALGGGSFKAKVRTLYRGAANLFSGETLRAIVLGVIANFIYQHTLAPDEKVTVNVGPEEVLIRQGDTQVIVPRRVHDATQLVEKSPGFHSGIQGAIRAVDADPTVLSIGFSKEIDEQPPSIEIPRERFAVLPPQLTNGDPDFRDLYEVTDIQILRAILERSRRRWEFVWNGMRISAPVLDNQFYDEFFEHKITVAPGDRLRVRLRVRQRRAREIGIYINEGYEVIDVLEHVPRPRQARLHAPGGETGDSR